MKYKNIITGVLITVFTFLTLTGCSQQSNIIAPNEIVSQYVTQELSYENQKDKLTKYAHNFYDETYSDNIIKNYCNEILNQVSHEETVITQDKTTATVSINLKSVDFSYYTELVNSELILRLDMKIKYPETYATYEETYEEFTRRITKEYLTKETNVMKTSTIVAKLELKNNQWEITNQDKINQEILSMLPL